MTERRWREAALTACGVALTAAMLSRLAPIVRDQLAAPFDLISEGPHLTLIEAIRSGYNIYAPASYTAPPFRLVPYPPLFHAVMALLPTDPTNPFLPGRLAAMLCMLAASASLFAICRRRDWLGIPLIAWACFFLIRPVTGNTAYLRSDSAGLLLSVAAVVTVATRPATRRTAIVAATCCALALACKQSFVAAPVACFVYLVARRAAVGLTFAGTYLLVVALGSALATWRWGAGFWYCVTLAATQYPRDWPSFVEHWQDMLKQPLFAWILAMLPLAALASLRRGRAAGPYPLYVACSFAAQSMVLSGIGGSNHYFFEPVLASLLWLVTASTSADDSPPRDWIVAAALAALLLCAASELHDSVPEEYRYTTPERTAERVRNREAVIAAMRQRGIGHERVLNLKDTTVSFDYPGEVNISDPFLYGVMLQVGQLDVEPLLQAIRDRRFDAVFVASGVVNADNQQGEHPMQRVLRELFRSYALAIHGAEVNVLVPIDGSSRQGGGTS